MSSNGESELLPPTFTADRVCECIPGAYYRNASTTSCIACTACNSDGGAAEYMASECTATADRQCVAHDVCAEGNEFEAVAATATSPRECQALSGKCGNGISSIDGGPPAFEAEAPTPTSDRKCKPVSICNAGEYQTSKPNATADRICKACSGTEDFQDQAEQVACKPTAACLAGIQYELAAPTVSSNRECTLCSPPCASTLLETSPCAGTADRVCESPAPCGAGYFRLRTEPEAKCKPHKTCDPNAELQMQPGTAHSDTLCRAWTVCRAGTIEVSAPTASTDRTCSPCTDGITFTESANELKCTPCSPDSQCGSGFFRLPCRADQNARCAVCDEGTYTSSGDPGAPCVAWSLPCSAGHEQVQPPNAAQDRVCQPCVLGFYRDPSEDVVGESSTSDPTTKQCKPYTTCPDGLYGRGGSTSHDWECVAPPKTTRTTTTGTATTVTTRTKTSTTRTTVTTTRTATTTTPTDAVLLEESGRSASFELSNTMFVIIGVVGLIILVSIVACCCTASKKQDKNQAFAAGAAYAVGSPIGAGSYAIPPTSPDGRSVQLSMNDVRSPPPFSAPPVQFDNLMMSPGPGAHNPAGAAAMLTPGLDASYMVGQAPSPSPGLNRFFPGGSNTGGETPSLWAVAAETHI